MAIINSMVIGRGKGRIGNVTLATLNGQTIAKQAKGSTSSIGTPSQIAAREKFTVGYQLYKWQLTFLLNTRKLAVKREYTYNAYVRNFYSFFPRTQPISYLDLIRPFLISRVGYWSAFIPLKIQVVNGKYYLHAETKDNLFWIGTRIRVVLLNTTNGNIFNRSFKTTLIDFNSGIFEVFETSGTYDYGAFYLYTNDRTILSTIRYFKITMF